MPIRTRIAVLGAGVVALTLALFGLLVWLALASGLVRQQNQALARRAEQAVAAIRTASPTELQPHRDLAPTDLADSTDSFVETLDGNGAPITSTGLLDGQPPAIPPALLGAAGGSGAAQGTLQPRAGVKLRVDVRPWSRPDLGLAGFVVAGQPTRGTVSSLRGIGVIFILAALLTLVAAFLAIWFLSGRALRPFTAIARTAEEIGRTQDLGRRLPPAATDDELGLLTRSFNGMLFRLDEARRNLAEANRRLAASLEAQNRFVADASHELRTPLTTILSNAGFLLQHPEADPVDRRMALEDISGEAERMSRLVRDLLTLARADAGFHLEKQPLDLRGVMREVTRQARAVHSDRQILSSEGPEIELSGNADALRQLLWILLDNAVKHTAAGGRIVIEAAASDGAALVSVADDGPGVPEADLERIFERFYQADRARSSGGAGLGLAIAGWIVAEHGGRICAQNNPSRGATFTVELPLA